MPFRNAFIPYGGYWSTPFCRWQGSFQNLHAVEFAGEVCRRALGERKIPPSAFDGVVLGITIPQKSVFYGAPWLAALIGAEGITGPMVGQACATSARCIGDAAARVETGVNRSLLVVCADRTSSGPLLVYPNPAAPGATQATESWVWDNFGNDPWARNSMLQTAENVAKECGFTKEQQDQVALTRYRQYLDAAKDDRKFQKRYMVSPIEVKDARGKKVLATVAGDEGVYPTTAEGLAGLKPVLKDGTVTSGTQTYPADGNAGIILTSRERAHELSADGKIEVQLLGFGEARTKKGYMAMAVVPAAKAALEHAGVEKKDIAAIKTHNPFAVNDLHFAKEFGVGIEQMNNYGCSLIYGHPQGPTGSRLVMEMVEELALKGGGCGLFGGCAAGDTAAALVIRVTVR